MFGPGKYDDLCTAAREKAKANGAVLIILDGEHGQGFSVQVPGRYILALPAMLRHVADDIEADLKRKVVLVNPNDVTFKYCSNCHKYHEDK